MSTKSPIEIYTDVQKQLREINALEGISGLLGWDEVRKSADSRVDRIAVSNSLSHSPCKMTMMPSASGASRGAQKEALAGVIYDKKASPALGENLKILMSDENKLNRVPFYPLLCFSTHTHTQIYIFPLPCCAA